MIDYRTMAYIIFLILIKTTILMRIFQFFLAFSWMNHLQVLQVYNNEEQLKGKEIKKKRENKNKKKNLQATSLTVSLSLVS